MVPPSTLLTGEWGRLAVLIARHYGPKGVVFVRQASIDFEEDVDAVLTGDIRRQLASVLQELDLALSTATRGRLLTTGLQVGTSNKFHPWFCSAHVVWAMHACPFLAFIALVSPQGLMCQVTAPPLLSLVHVWC